MGTRLCKRRICAQRLDKREGSDMIIYLPGLGIDGRIELGIGFIWGRQRSILWELRWRWRWHVSKRGTDNDTDSVRAESSSSAGEKRGELAWSARSRGRDGGGEGASNCDESDDETRWHGGSRERHLQRSRSRRKGVLEANMMVATIRRRRLAESARNCDTVPRNPVRAITGVWAYCNNT